MKSDNFIFLFYSILFHSKLFYVRPVTQAEAIRAKPEDIPKTFQVNFKLCTSLCMLYVHMLLSTAFVFLWIHDTLLLLFRICSVLNCIFRFCMQMRGKAGETVTQPRWWIQTANIMKCHTKAMNLFQSCITSQPTVRYALNLSGICSDLQQLLNAKVSISIFFGSFTRYRLPLP